MKSLDELQAELDFTGHVHPSAVRALIEIAEAASAFDGHVLLNGGCHKECPEHDELHAALEPFAEARLLKGDKE